MQYVKRRILCESAAQSFSAFHSFSIFAVFAFFVSAPVKVGGRRPRYLLDINSEYSGDQRVENSTVLLQN